MEACITSPRFSILVNGNLEGYFKGKKWIRQGDPLSPYLFVIATEVLSQLLDVVAIDSRLQYHSFCSKVKLTHLGLADDMLIFLKGDLDCFKTVLDIFQEFYLMSSLKLNPRKTEFFCVALS